MTEAYVTTCLPEHIRAIRSHLRDEDRDEVQCIGLTVPEALWRSYRHSCYARTFIVDGKVAAVGGCGGSALGAFGQPWLLTAPEVEEVPKLFVREARKQVAEMLGLYPFLENIVAAKYVRACRFLELIGFSLDEARALPSGALFHRFWMERG